MSDKEVLLRKFHSGKYLEASPAELEDAYLAIQQFMAMKSSTLDPTENYDLLQYQFCLALATCRDLEAKNALQLIVDKFGLEPQRVGVLKSMYIEAVEGPDAALKFLEQRPANDLGAVKRKAVLSKSKQDYKTYINELLHLVTEVTPMDAEAWSELAETYVKTGHYNQAISSLEEVILIHPHAYNAFSRIAELYHLSAVTKTSLSDQMKALQLSVTHYSRAVEICPTYVRGWCGLYVVANKASAWPKLDAKEEKRYNSLVEIASKQLKKIVKERLSTEDNLAAARTILGTS